MTVRFLADENFDNAIVKGLLRRDPEVDVVTVHDVGLLSMPGVLEIRESVPRLQVIEELLLVVGASEPSDWRNSVHYLPLR